uniref:CHM2A protein n=1 Tax=Gongylonema pulchrum TaxID=637853 RepID=A0A183EVG3_9BILA
LDSGVGEEPKKKKLDIALLCWSLMLLSSAFDKSQLEALWGKHVKVMEAMKANMKMSQEVNSKLLENIDLEKKIIADAIAMQNPSTDSEAMNLIMLGSEMAEAMSAALLSPSGSDEMQLDEIYAKM